MEAAGVDWHHKKNKSENSWNDKYEQLIDLKNNTGTTTPPREGNKALSAWCAGQRIYYQKGNLSAERIEKLNILDFKWEVQEELWEEKFALLTEYYKKYSTPG